MPNKAEKPIHTQLEVSIVMQQVADTYMQYGPRLTDSLYTTRAQVNELYQQSGLQLSEQPTWFHNRYNRSTKEVAHPVIRATAKAISAAR